MLIALRKAYRDLTRRRLRSFLTIIGIIIGVAGIVAITSTSKNMTAAQSSAYNNNSQQDMRWWVGSAPHNVLGSIDLIPNVAASELRATYYTKWYITGAWRDILFNGIRDFGDTRVNRVDLVEGTWPRRGEVVLESSARCSACRDWRRSCVPRRSGQRIPPLAGDRLCQVALLSLRDHNRYVGGLHPRH